MCAEIKIRAERRMGELIPELALHGGDRKSESRLHDVTLKDFGVEKIESHRYQQIASVPVEKFEEHIQETGHPDEQAQRNLSHSAPGDGPRESTEQPIYRLKTRSGHGVLFSRYRGKKNETETVSFSKDTANKTGKTERAIRNHAKIGKELKSVADKLELKKHLAIEAKERQATSTGGANPQLTQKIEEAGKGEAADIAAKEIGT